MLQKKRQEKGCILNTFLHSCFIPCKINQSVTSIIRAFEENMLVWENIRRKWIPWFLLYLPPVLRGMHLSVINLSPDAYMDWNCKILFSITHLQFKIKASFWCHSNYETASGTMMQIFSKVQIKTSTSTNSLIKFRGRYLLLQTQERVDLMLAFKCALSPL